MKYCLIHQNGEQTTFRHTVVLLSWGFLATFRYLYNESNLEEKRSNKKLDLPWQLATLKKEKKTPSRTRLITGIKDFKAYDSNQRIFQHMLLPTYKHTLRPFIRWEAKAVYMSVRPFMLRKDKWKPALACLMWGFSVSLLDKGSFFAWEGLNLTLLDIHRL